MADGTEKATKRDRTLGYIVLMLLIASILTTAGYTTWYSLFYGHERIIGFDDIGNLRIDDPVKIKGTVIGAVEQVEHSGEMVLVTVKTERRMHLFSDYTIKTVDKGLMGDRIIVIEPGSPHTGTVAPEDTLRGSFVIGISEVIGLAWQLQDLIHFYDSLALALLHDSLNANDTSFVGRFSTIMDDIDSLSALFAGAVNTFESQWIQGLETVDTVLSTLNRLTFAMAALTPEYLDNVTGHIETLQRFVDRIEGMIADIEPKLDSLYSPDHALWQNELDSLQIQIEAVNEIIHHFRRRSIKLRPQF